MVKASVLVQSTFVRDCFANIGQYEAGLAAKLLLKAGATLTVRDTTADERAVSFLFLFDD